MRFQVGDKVQVDPEAFHAHSRWARRLRYKANTRNAIVNFCTGQTAIVSFLDDDLEFYSSPFMEAWRDTIEIYVPTHRLRMVE